MMTSRSPTSVVARQRTRLACCCIIGLLLAGCASEGPAPAGPIFDTLSDARIAAPEWHVGDWWRLRVKDLVGGRDYELTRVVASVNATHYQVGMPAGGFANETLLLPAPGFGAVARADLSWMFMDSAFEPLRFPLEDGMAWTTTLQGVELAANASIVAPGRAHVELHGPASAVTLLYDAHARSIVSFVNEDWVEFEVLAHGTGYEGDVMVPSGMRHAIYGGRIAGVLGWSPAQMPTTDAFVVSQDATTLSLMLAAGPTEPPADLPALTGIFREHATAPNGTSVEVLALPGDMLRVEYFAFSDPAGTWRFDHVAGGPGAAFASGVEYRALTLRLD